MRITSKGQVTIPIEIREQLGLRPGVEVDFVIDGDTIRIKRAARGAKRGRSVVRRMRGKGDVRLSTDEIMALWRGEDWRDED
jgi:AbrB family looped-hinge helix DNA binding protein